MTFLANRRMARRAVIRAGMVQMASGAVSAALREGCRDPVTSLNVRTTGEFRDRIDEAAKQLAMDRSAWVLMACENELRKSEGRGREIQVQMRSRKRRVGVPAGLCSHPPQLRSEKGADGSSRCMACGSMVRPL